MNGGLADGVAILILVLWFIACGLGPGCNFKGPGLAYKVDGVEHHLLMRGDK